MLKERKIAEVPVTVHVFYGHRIALHRGKPYLAGKWEDVTRCESFEWKTKRDPNRVIVKDDGSIRTFPIDGFRSSESLAYKPADFDKRFIPIVNDEGESEEIDEDVLLEAMPDGIEFLPHE